MDEFLLGARVAEWPRLLPACGETIQLVQCHTYKAGTCSGFSNATRFSVPMACDERACFNAKAGQGYSFSTISETAMQGDAVGGKALFATAMTLVALLFTAIGIAFGVGLSLAVVRARAPR